MINALKISGFASSGDKTMPGKMGEGIIKKTKSDLNKFKNKIQIAKKMGKIVI